MNEIKLELDDAMDLVSQLRGASLYKHANRIEAQLPKPTTEEPTEFGSVVRARFRQWGDNFGPTRWMQTGAGWTAESDSFWSSWADLENPKVLRVGVGDTAAEQKALTASDLGRISIAAHQAKVRAAFHADDCTVEHEGGCAKRSTLGVGDTAAPTTRTEWGVKFDAPGNGYPGEDRIEVFESEDAAVECVEGRTRAVVVSRQVTEWAEAGA